MGYVEEGDIEEMFREEPIKELCERILRRGGDFLLDRVREYTPVENVEEAAANFGASRSRVPGTLQRSWKIRDADGATTELALEVWTDDPIAEYVEWDTRAHWIRPKADREAASVVESRKPRALVSDPTRRPTQEELAAGVVGKAALRFVENGHVIYARAVFHPFTPGKHMMAKAIADLEAEFERIANEEMETWAAQENSR
jgi:hypothetical protein